MKKLLAIHFISLLSVTSTAFASTPTTGETLSVVKSTCYVAENEQNSDSDDVYKKLKELGYEFKSSEERVQNNGPYPLAVLSLTTFRDSAGMRSKIESIVEKSKVWTFVGCEQPILH